MSDSVPRSAPRSGVLALLAATLVVGVILAENVGANLLSEILLHLPGIDKAMHFVQYLIVFFVLWWAAGVLRVGAWTRIAIAVGGGLAIGMLDETVQRQMAHRTFELEDLAVDAAALTAGAALVWPVRQRVATVAAWIAALAVTGVFGYQTNRRLEHYNRAILYERHHDLRNARLEYLKSIQVGHATPGVYNSLAWAELESGAGDAATALRYAQRGIAARPDDPDFLDTYGWALHHVGRSREALPVLERALAGAPDMYCIDYHLGAVLRALRRDCDARRRFERQIVRFPQSDEAARAKHELMTLGCASPTL